MRKSDPPIIVKELLPAPIAAVWEAITDPDQMRRWYFDNIPAFEPVVGFETEFDVKSGGRIFPHQWKVLEVQPPSRLKYQWRFRGYPGDSFVLWELSEQGEGTRLRLTAQVLEDFPDEIPEFRRESCQGGWDYFIGQSLKAYLQRLG